MTALVHIIGDLFTSTTAARAQSVNTSGVMGGGIALPFAQRDPAMKQRYMELCASGDLTPGKVMYWKSTNGDPDTYNLAGQDYPGPHARLEWLQSAAAHMLEHAEANGIDSISMPRVGAGIGGLNWDDVESVLEALPASSVRLEIWAREEDLE